MNVGHDHYTRILFVFENELKRLYAGLYVFDQGNGDKVFIFVSRLGYNFRDIKDFHSSSIIIGGKITKIAALQWFT